MGLDADPERDGTTWNPRIGFGLFGDAGNQILVIDDASVTSPNSEAMFLTVKTAGTYYAYVDTTAQTSGGPTQTYLLSVAVHPYTAQGVNCTTYTSTDIPRTIPAAGGLVSSTITVPGHPRIADLDVSIQLNHLLMADIDAQLRSPAGNTNGLFTDVGATATAGQAQMDLTLDDEAAWPIGIWTIMKGVSVQPELAYRLWWFDGEDAGGTWTLELYDDTNNVNGGTLTGWSITVCEPAPVTCAGVVATLYSQDFEAGTGGFTHSGAADSWARGLPSGASAPVLGCGSGANCWKTNLTGTYSASSNCDLLSPPIDLSTVTAPVVVSWTQAYQSESATYDYPSALVRNVGGANPRTLFQFLDATMSHSVGTASTTIQESAGWGQFGADISSYAGGSVELKFNMTSDSSVNYSGYAIDDVRVTGCCTVASCPPPGLCTVLGCCTESTCPAPGVCTVGGGCCTPAGCDDANVCTVDICDPQAGCIHQSDPNVCDDNDVCTADSCDPQTGQCHHAAITCNDNNACTDDACVSPAAGCVYTPNDNNACSDGNACTNDACVGGSCLSTPNADPCDDGNLCTTGDVCANGACAGAPVVCNDGNPCTDDACSPATGQCVYTNNNANPCSDGNVCTLDACVNGSCVSSPSPATVSSSGTITIPSTGAAAPYPSTIAVSGIVGTVASVTVTLTGITHTYPDDLDFLLVGPTGANAVIMSDVGGSTGVTSLTLTLSDLAAASLPDAGPLVAGTFKPTNIDTTTDAFPAPAPVPTGNSALSVFNGLGAAGPWKLYVYDDASGDSGSLAGWSLTLTLSCDDGDACTADSCDPVQGCVHAPVNCDDSLACTLDGCEPAVGCVHTTDPALCDDGNACTIDICNAQGQCDHLPLTCNDNNPCTDDFCDPGTGCYAVPNDANPCTDNSLCTADACVAGSCISTPVVVCDDGNACTDDACNPATGECVYTNDDTNACTDGNACTVDRCANGVCLSTIMATGSSSGAITIVDLAPATPYPSTITIPAVTGTVAAVEVTLHGFTHGWPSDVDILLVGPTGANALIMSDAGGSSSTTNVTFTLSDSAASPIPTPIVAGSWQPTNVGAGDSFPAPAPAPAGGSALSVFNGTNPAGAWNLYIVDDEQYVTGSLTGWSLAITLTCDDGDACTADSCDPQTGQCLHVPVVCDDGDACTSDSCNPQTGQCVHTAVDCSDPDQCTVDGCNPQTGCTHTPVNCNDGNACTDDYCDPLTGCQNPPRSCDDNNVCTQDSCDPQTGCLHIPGPNGIACTDPYPCTQNDQCYNGFCIGTPVPPPAPVGDTLDLVKLPGNLARLAWTAPSGPYNVYRGLRAPVGAWTYDHTCFATMLPSPLATDPGMPPVGGSYYYLVSRKDNCGESALGYRYPLAPIPNTAPCP